MDKSLTHYRVIMIKEDLSQYPIYTLPRGYSFSYYELGDEKHWADIEVAVDEFDNREDALSYFEREFAPHIEEFKKRCLFIKDAEGEFIATTTGWYGNLLSKECMPRIHWVAVKPEYRGMGLAKALMTRSLDIIRDIHGNGEVYLTTQTWSYKAINLYLEFGFKPYIDKKPKSWEDTEDKFEFESRQAWESIFDKLRIDKYLK